MFEKAKKTLLDPQNIKYLFDLSVGSVTVEGVTFRKSPLGEGLVASFILNSVEYTGAISYEDLQAYPAAYAAIKPGPPNALQQVTNWMSALKESLTQKPQPTPTGIAGISPPPASPSKEINAQKTDEAYINLLTPRKPPLRRTSPGTSERGNSDDRNSNIPY